MEIIESLAGFLVAFVVLCALMQVAFSYALQVLSEKNELPEFASFLAWIPILNLYPLIRVGGGDFRKFVLGAVGCVVLGVASAAASAFVGPLVGGIALGLMAIGILVYMTKIVMRTAERRGLTKWLGLLTYVPLAGFAVYPFIAFYDGFRPPHKIGLVIGLLIAFGPIPGQIKMLDTLSQSAGAYEAAQQDAQEDDFPELAGIANDAEIDGALAQMGSLMALAAELASLDAMNPADPEQATAMRDLMDGVRQQMRDAGDGLDPAAVAQLEALIESHEQRLAEQAGGEVVAANDAPNDVTEPITSAIARTGERGFDVPTTAPCPVGAELNGAAPPQGSKLWCSRPNGGLKHGWMTEWDESGHPTVAGEYRDGLRVGVWTRWHPNGEKRVQAQFVDGRQDGPMIAWDEAGNVVHESRFESGELARR